MSSPNVFIRHKAWRNLSQKTLLDESRRIFWRIGDVTWQPKEGFLLDAPDPMIGDVTWQPKEGRLLDAPDPMIGDVT